MVALDLQPVVTALEFVLIVGVGGGVGFLFFDRILDAVRNGLKPAA